MSLYQLFCTHCTLSASPVDWLPRVYVDCPLHVNPRDRCIGGKRDPTLCIRVDTSSYPHACVEGPLQKAL